MSTTGAGPGVFTPFQGRPPAGEAVSAAERREEAKERRFEEEALPHLRALHRAACRITGSVQDGEDLVQETCLRAFRSFHRFTPGTDMRGWLFTILYRARTDAFRKSARRPRTVALTHDQAHPATPSPVDAHEISRALEGLPEAFRQAVLLRDVEGFRYEEIARILGVPVGTVMSRIHRGRLLLRAVLGRGTPRASLG